MVTFSLSTLGEGRLNQKYEELLTRIVTESAPNKEKELFRLAFDLAFFIHGNKEVAFFIAEDALEGLTSVFGYQKKNRAPSERLRGFWKWGERTRPVRKKLIFNQHQMLQWLVYKESQSWERLTERDEGFYSPIEEDLIIRYVEYLVLLSARLGSFYVTLAICSLLHQLDRRETRFFYDVLTQNDAARMKDTHYIGKQKIELLSKVSQRFADKAETITKTGSDRQLVMRSSNLVQNNLVHESLRRFTPWDTSCVVGPAFDVTDIPKLYFADTSSPDQDEDIVEMNRIHTVLHPECFNHFVNELGKYVRSLPKADLDSSCGFDDVNDRIVLPHFANLQDGPPRDRYNPPNLRSEDYVRLQRTLEARGHRKRAFVPNSLSVYADGKSLYEFDPRAGIGTCTISSETFFLEVRGRDSDGEVVLAALPLVGFLGYVEEFEDSIVHEGGQTLELKLQPFQKAPDANFQLQISYHQSQSRLLTLAKGISAHIVKPFDGSLFAKPYALRFVAVGLILVVILGLTGLLISRLKPRNSPGQAVVVPPYRPSLEVPSPQAEPSKEPGDIRRVSALVAQARWTSDPKAALNAISLEPTRSEIPSLDLSRAATKLFLSMSVYDNKGRPYDRYRLTISAGNNLLWRTTLRAPKITLTGYAHILELTIFPRKLNKGIYDLHVEGVAEKQFHSIGHATIEWK